MVSFLIICLASPSENESDPFSDFVACQIEHVWFALKNFA